MKVFNFNKNIFKAGDRSAKLTYSQFQTTFKKQIDRLSEHRLLMFALDICERVLPDYNNFYHLHQWGDPGALMNAVEYCRSHGIAAMDNNKLREHFECVDLVIPDIDDFGDFDGSYALNAGTSVLALLEFLMSKDKSHILELSTYMTDTLDFKLSEANPELTNQELANHPNLITEMKRQLELTK